MCRERFYEMFKEYMKNLDRWDREYCQKVSLCELLHKIIVGQVVASEGLSFYDVNIMPDLILPASKYCKYCKVKVTKLLWLIFLIITTC